MSEACRDQDRGEKTATDPFDFFAAWSNTTSALWDGVLNDPAYLRHTGKALEAGFRLKQELDRSLEATLGASRFATKGDVEAILLRLDSIEERLITLAERHDPAKIPSSDRH
ncbi:hypothetical protein ACFL59_09020 [Planctomycetota bacterium]